MGGRTRPHFEWLETECLFTTEKRGGSERRVQLTEMRIGGWFGVRRRPKDR